MFIHFLNKIQELHKMVFNFFQIINMILIVMILINYKYLNVILI